MYIAVPQFSAWKGVSLEKLALIRCASRGKVKMKVKVKLLIGVLNLVFRDCLGSPSVNLSHRAAAVTRGGEQFDSSRDLLPCLALPYLGIGLENNLVSHVERTHQLQHGNFFGGC